MAVGEVMTFLSSVLCHRDLQTWEAKWRERATKNFAFFFKLELWILPYCLKIYLMIHQLSKLKPQAVKCLDSCMN